MAGKLHTYKKGETVEILGVEVFATGVHNGDTYDVADLEQMVGAADKVGFEAPLKLGHMEDDDTAALLKKEGMPAFGWARNLRVQGKKLLADFMEVPKRLGDLIKKGAYRRVSAEIYWNFQKGKDVFPRVLKAVSLLGAEIPAVTDLAGIEALYKKLGLEAKGKDEAGHEFRTYMGETWGGLQLKHKEDVAYRLSDGTLERCGTCRFYLGNAELGAVGSCTLVYGEIAAEGICDLYEAREAFTFPGGVEEGATEAAKKKKVPRTYTIEKRGDKWCLVAKGGGETLGCHDSEAEAQAQEAAIKAKKGGYGQDERLVLWMSREAVARTCPACAEKMAFAGIKALKITYDPATKLYAGFSEGLCTKFSPGEGFRTRCMESSVGAAADDPGAMCNKLETWCFDNGYLESKTVEGQGAKAHGDPAGAGGAGHAHAHVAEGGGMDEKDKKIAELTAKIADLEAKLTSERANSSAATMELPALKQQLTEAQDEIRKIRTDRRSDRIKAFVADMVRQKRIVPAMAGDLARDLEHCDDQKVITFQASDGKDVKQTQLEARMAFYTKQPVLTQFSERELTRGEGSGHAEGDPEPTDVKTEVHRKIVKYQNEHGGPAKMVYKEAFDAVMAADQDLKERYALAGR
jgi:hypothetical protein